MKRYDKRLLQIDILIQAVLISVVILTVMIQFAADVKPGSFYLGLMAFLLLLIWQFFSGIYIGLEYRMRHRSFFQISYFCLGLIGLVFTILGMPTGLVIVFVLTPLIIIGYFLVSCMDLRKYTLNRNNYLKGDEGILDSGDIFE